MRHTVSWTFNFPWLNITGKSKIAYNTMDEGLETSSRMIHRKTASGSDRDGAQNTQLKDTEPWDRLIEARSLLRLRTSFFRQGLTKFIMKTSVSAHWW